jgi:hypothetical protein
LSRYNKLHENLGRFGAIQVVGLSGLLLLICGLLASEQRLLPLAGLIIGVATATLGREQLLGDLVRTSGLLRWGWRAIMILVLGVSLLRESVAEAGMEDSMLAAIMLCASAYLSAVFWVNSDPAVKRLR